MTNFITKIVKLHNNLIEGLFQCLKLILIDKLYAHKAIELTFKKIKLGIT